MNTRDTGSHYEQMAADYLTGMGYEIITMNYLCKNGEIDIIARDGNTLVFCEVKYRSSSRYGLPEEAVDYRKQAKIRKSAAYYMYSNKYSDSIMVRFDVIAFLNNHITHIKDAF